MSSSCKYFNLLKVASNSFGYFKCLLQMSLFESSYNNSFEMVKSSFRFHQSVYKYDKNNKNSITPYAIHTNYKLMFTFDFCGLRQHFNSQLSIYNYFFSIVNLSIGLSVFPNSYSLDFNM